MTVQRWVQLLNLVRLSIGSPQSTLALPGCSFPACPVCLLILNALTDAWILGQLLSNIYVEFPLVRLLRRARVSCRREQDCTKLYTF